MGKYALKSEIDLTRHVRTPAGVEHFHLPIGAPITGRDRMAAKAALKVSKPEEWGPNPKYVSLNGQKMTLDDAIPTVSRAYDWHTRDRAGLGNNPDAAASVMEQDRAQIVGKIFHDATDGNAPMDRQLAASTWQEYQSKYNYLVIQDVLRDDEEYPGVDNDVVRKAVSDVFKDGGYTTVQPTTMFRALKSETIDWAAKLKPGTTFTDTGIVSTTAHERFAQGWLGGDATQENPRAQQANDVVMEIRVPAGTRVVGGDPGFIETMLRPGTKFKVISSTPGTKATAVNPLSHDRFKVHYTHVVAEVVGP